MRTLGGLQLWTDFAHRSGWKLQQHSLTGRCRLLNPANERHASGDANKCWDSWQDLLGAGRLPANQESVVILAHGLFRTAGCWRAMIRELNKQTPWQAIDFHYASTRRPMRDHAVALQSLVRTLGPEVKDIYFVGHSMGNIVLRYYQGELSTGRLTGLGDDRIRRVVMLAPPNHGSKMARVLQQTGIFGILSGRSGVELGRDWPLLLPHLATPRCEFGIIAGGDPHGTRGWNPFLSGANDLTVTVEEASLAGAADMWVHPFLHPTIMRKPSVCEATIRFLRTGRFLSTGVRQPIQSDAAAKSCAAPMVER